MYFVDILSKTMKSIEITNHVNFCVLFIMTKWSPNAGFRTTLSISPSNLLKSSSHILRRWVHGGFKNYLLFFIKFAYLHFNPVQTFNHVCPTIRIKTSLFGAFENSFSLFFIWESLSFRMFISNLQMNGTQRTKN